MIIPKLKRVKVATEQELHTWLRKNADIGQDVMIVTCNKTSRDKHISSDAVRRAFHEFGWTPGRSYTLEGNLDGHIGRPA